jgi:hypothetical protein
MLPAKMAVQLVAMPQLTEVSLVESIVASLHTVLIQKTGLG